MLDDLAHPVGIKAKVAQSLTGHATFFYDQTHQDVFCINIRLAQALSLFMSQREHPARSLGKPFHACHGVILLNHIRSL
jgi:hypothetical protein